MNHYYNLFTSNKTLCNWILFKSHVIVAGVIANRWTRKIRRMVGAYCNGYMTTWVTWRRTFTAVGRVQHYSVRFISPEDILYIYIHTHLTTIIYTAYTPELLLRVCVRVCDIMCACDRVEKPVLSIIIDNGQPSENSGAFVVLRRG